MPDFERLILNRDIKRIVPMLSSRRTDLRLRAVQALGEARAWRAVDELRRVLDDPDPIVRLAALDALVMIRRPESMDVVVDALRHPGRDVVEHAWRLLARAEGLGSEAIVRALPAFRDEEATLERMLALLDTRMLDADLIALLDHPDELVMKRACEKLEAKGAAADAALLHALWSGSDRQASAVAGLLRRRVAELVPSLIDLYRRVDDPGRQRMLLYLLSETRESAIADLLEQELRNPDSRVRTTAMALIARYKDRAVSAFKTLLKEPDFPDRSRLIAFVRQHWRMWGEALIDLLAVGEFDEWRVREFAKMALGGRSALLPQVVLRFVEDGDLHVDDVADLVLDDPAASTQNVSLLCRDTAALPLEQERRLIQLFERVLEREGPAAVDLLQAVSTSSACASPGLPIRYLAQLGADAVPVLVDLLRHTAATSDPELLARAVRVRRDALSALVEQPATAVPHLIQALQLPGSTPEVREAILRAGDRALPSLVAALENAWRDGRDWKTYSALLEAMAGARSDVLLPIVAHQEPGIRRAVFLALRGRKGDELEQAMVAVVNGAVGQREVSEEVLWAIDVLSDLRGLGARSAMQRLVTHPDTRARDKALRYVRRMVRFPSGVWQKLDDA